MSASQILEELPKLNSDERQVISKRLRELQLQEIEKEDDDFTDACAAESFRMTDEMEAADDARRAR
jgi:hypothetical protein